MNWFFFIQVTVLSYIQGQGNLFSLKHVKYGKILQTGPYLHIQKGSTKNGKTLKKIKVVTADKMFEPMLDETEFLGRKSSVSVLVKMRSLNYSIIKKRLIKIN